MSRSPSQSQILSLSADGSGSQPERLTTQDVEGALIGYTPDGSVLLFDNPKASRIWRLNVGDGSMSPWFPTPFTQTGGRLSPDGRFLAYASNQSGADEVWVRPYPGPGAPIRVSTGGGLKPLWAHDGSEIFYENGPKLMAARVIAREPDVRIEAPRLLFEGGFVRDGTDPHIRFMDVAPDGRILFVEAPDTTVTASIVVTQSWDEELRRLVR
jgi:Tol biopolymer transport system component